MLINLFFFSLCFLTLFLFGFCLFSFSFFVPSSFFLGFLLLSISFRFFWPSQTSWLSFPNSAGFIECFTLASTHCQGSWWSCWGCCISWSIPIHVAVEDLWTCIWVALFNLLPSFWFYFGFRFLRPFRFSFPLSSCLLMCWWHVVRSEIFISCISGDFFLFKFT